MDSFYILSVDKNRHFLTPSPPHLVHVVIECPLSVLIFGPEISLILNTPGPSKQARLSMGTLHLWCQNVSAAMCLAEMLGAEIS